MTGISPTAPAVRNVWVYLFVATLLAAMGGIAPVEAARLATDPAGAAAVVAITAGFLVKSSMALTPWAFVSVAIAIHAVGRTTHVADSFLPVTQLVAITGALLIAIFQLRVRFVSGEAARRPARGRWGSVLVAATASVAVAWVVVQGPVVVSTASAAEEPTGAQGSIVRSDYLRAVRVGRVGHPTLIEGSGLAASEVNRGRLWAHNDSGHPAHLYCLEGNGDPCGVFDVVGAEARDWEDISLGPGPEAGKSYVYVGDIGDNARAHASIIVYRFLEPRLDATSASSTPTAPVATGTVDRIELRYPDGAHDAESLIVHPQTGDIYIITKELVSGVYRASAPFETAEATTLERVGRFSIFATLADRTGATISPDGRRVALATYGGAFELKLPLDATGAIAPFDSIWKRTARPISAPFMMQLEAITYSASGRSVFLTSEGAGSPLYKALPRRSGAGS